MRALRRNLLGSGSVAHVRKSLALTIFLLILFYVALVVMLTFLQRRLIYHPIRESSIQPEDVEFPPGQVHTVEATSQDGLRLRGYHFLADGERAFSDEEANAALANGQYVFLYFSGNAANRRYRKSEPAVLTGLGAQVVLYDYRGYGDNPGRPSEAWLLRDARSEWDDLVQDRDVRPDRIILYGESIGGAVAVALAADLSQEGRPPGGLVLRSTFSSLVEVAAYHYWWLPVRRVLVDRYPSEDRIGRVTCPILQLHGTRDRIVPLSDAQRLFEAAPAQSAQGIKKRFVTLTSAGHNDVLYVAQQDLEDGLRSFLEDLSGQ